MDSLRLFVTKQAALAVAGIQLPTLGIQIQNIVKEEGKLCSENRSVKPKARD